MKDRLMDVLAWGVWIGVFGWLLFCWAVHELEVLGSMSPADQLGAGLLVIAGVAGPLLTLWAVSWVATGSLRLLPWQKPSSNEL